MVFESPTGFERNRTVQIALAITLVTLACGFFIYTKTTAPSSNVVDGVYRNECCPDITIKDEHIAQGNGTLVLRTRNMKFGLTGYVNGRFTNDGVQSSDEVTAITFFNRNGKFALSLPIAGRNYTFTRIEG